MVVLNMAEATAKVALELVDAEAARLLALLESELPPRDRAMTIVRLQHVGVLKHRLEYNLGLPAPFRGPVEWGYARKLAAEPDGGPATGDLFERQP
ncbi:MAG: hypothetical protein IPG77_14185 [Betaproteobacteria bacterium]|nr:hypothetical protein [Betaproteobacteria bacterium]